ncbi:MAG: hypothetical protein GEU98_06485 [Pseudonocardiaceae bacterium]|nr:hypothetical protein [Pseudonocardiaceae bacterium]
MHSTRLTRRSALRYGAGLASGVLGPTLLTGCGSSASADAFPDRPIQVIIAYAAGGGTDVGARILQPYVEAELGVPIEVVNRPGGGGWSGWNEIVTAEPTGYVIGFINTPNFMTGYLDPRLGRTEISYENFTPLGNQVTDFSAVAIHPDDDRFDDLPGVINHARGQALTVTSTGVGSDDHYASLGLSDRYGTQFDVLHGEGASDGITALLGRHVDLAFANVGELKSLHDDGELKVVGVMADGRQRSPHLPDVPTFEEEGFGGFSSWSSRGLAGPANIDPRVVDKLAGAIKRGIQNREHIGQLAEQGLAVDYRSPSEHKKMLIRDERTTRQLGTKYIWG